MKRLPAVLAVSLVSNLLLAAAWLSASRPTPIRPPEPDLPSPSPSLGSPVASASTATSNPVLAWSQWLTAQAPGRTTAEIVADLRAAGCPLPMLRAIVADLVDQEFAERRAALRAASPPRRYWESGFNKDAVPRTAYHDLGILDIEAHARRRELLGDDEESPQEVAERIRQYGDLSAAQIDQLQRIKADYDDLERQIGAAFPLPADSEKRANRIAELKLERERDQRALLGEDDYAEWQLRSSDAARSLRTRLRELAPTEDEFRTLYPLFAAAAKATPPMVLGANVPRETREAWSAQVQAIQADLLNQVREVLSPERFSIYEVTASSEYRGATLAADFIGASAEVAPVMARLEIDTKAAVKALDDNPQLDPAERARTLAALQQTARERLATVLTPAQLKRYEDVMGRWIPRLTAPQPTPGN